MDFKSIAGAALGASGNDMPLSAQSKQTLEELISKGIFKDKSDFVQFAVKAFMQYKMKGSSPAAITDIVKESPIGAGASESDIQGKILPLLTEAFNFAGKNKMGF